MYTININRVNIEGSDAKRASGTLLCDTNIG
jgi:hypothetical protein